MANYIGRYLNNFSSLDKSGLVIDMSVIYAIFRIIIGLVFMQHGVQKILGLLGGIGPNGATAPEFSLIWFAGIIELLGGALVVLGIFTRLVALIVVIEMAYAYFIVHFPQNFFPILNRGEVALLYLVSFLLILKNGAGRWSLERAVLGKEIF